MPFDVLFDAELVKEMTTSTGLETQDVRRLLSVRRTLRTTHHSIAKAGFDLILEKLYAVIP